MSKFDLLAWPKSPVEKTLVWVLRMAILFAAGPALWERDWLRVVALVAIVGGHVAAYWGLGRLCPARWKDWGWTGVDIALGGWAFWGTGGGPIQAGFWGCCLIGLIASRLDLGPALAVNGIVWLLFILSGSTLWPLESGSLWPVFMGSLIIYLTLTLIAHSSRDRLNRDLQADRDERLKLKPPVQMKEWMALQHIARELTATLERDHILRVVLESAVQITQAVRGYVMLREPTTGQFTLRAAHGDLAEEGRALESLDPMLYRLTQQVLESGNPQLTTDVGSESHTAWSQTDVRSAMAVPIFYEGEIVGLIHLQHTMAEAFCPEDLAFVQALAEQASIAIGNAMRYEEQVQLNAALRHRSEQMSSLLQVSHKLRADVPLEEILEEIAYAIQETVGFNYVVINVIKGNPPMVYRTAAAGVPLAMFEEMKAVVQPAERYERIFREEYRQGLCYFFPFQKQQEWESEVHTLVPMPAIREWHEGQWHPDDMLLAPLRGSGGRLLGYISVDGPRDGKRPSRSTLEALSIFANQAAIAVENARLFEQLQQRVHELATVNEIGWAINSALQLDDLLQTVHRQVSRVLDTASFLVAIHEQGSDEWELAYALKDGQPEPPARYKLEEGLIGYMIRTRQPVLFHSAQEQAAFYEENEIEPPDEWAQSWMGVPLVVADQVVGVMAVQSYEHKGLYGDQELALLSTIAAQVAVAVRNAQLYRRIVNLSNELEDRVEARTQDLAEALNELTVQRDRAETLYRITSELGAMFDLQRVLQHALQLFAEALGIQYGTITLLDQETGYLHLKAALGPDEERARKGERTPLRRGVGLAGWILEYRIPALVSDIAQDPRWIEINGPTLNIRSVIAAPLALGGGDILGVITLGHPQVGYFTEDHLRLVTAAAAQIAVAVNNSDLYSYITEQADQLGRMLQVLRAEAAKNRAILESIADGVLVLDQDGQVLLVNPAAEELLGFSAEQIERQHFRFMLGLGSTPSQWEFAQALYHELRTRLERKDASQPLQSGVVRLEAGNRVLVVHITPLVTASGEAPGLVAALRDISREAEVERLKNEFISTVSHELRTPMTSIKGYTDLLFLGMAGGLTDAQRSFLQIIKSNADRLTALVNDILDISRIETGRLRLTIESLNLGQIIADTVVAFQEQYREKALTLEWEIPADLPEVRGDAARVTQILNNLLANAWQYTPGGGRVRVSARPVDGFVQVDVADSGIGISPDDIGRIFDRFYRVDHPLVREVRGTGLGLSIVKMFVELLGGQIWVESEPGVGSTFSFTLPRTVHPTSEIPSELLTSEFSTVSGSRTKILVVEDDRDLALQMRQHLESEGYQVLLAGSGEDALWLAREEHPLLITLDIMLPDRDGFDLLEHLKKDPVTAPIPVILVSILNHAEEGYALGAVDYVVKPFDEEKLLRSVRQVLSGAVTGQAGRVLAVDDDPDILTFLKQALSFHGYEVWTASEGQEALDLVQQRQPDLILLDLKMPGLDGYEVIRKLRENEATRPIPIVVITASPVDKERDRVQVLSMGADQYLTKPLSVQMLLDEIKKAIAAKRSAQPMTGRPQ